MTWVARLLCRIRGHRFEKFADGYKRQCKCCAREEWIMANPHPRIGEPAVYWRHMDFEGLARRRFR